ncbi:MAG: coenzyme F420-0:L-glutamate ligase [Thermoproteota archaeon]|nr:coenzyme F420-0:L-glutamate ligase [Thermoproteota archaeon]MDQ4101926.1 coenzyme F420-0:L-glutamate ligase [Thermoproteota archaeon]
MQITPIRISNEIILHNDLSVIILEAIDSSQIEIENGDILVVTHKIVSKAEGRVIGLDSVEPSTRAISMAKEHDKDPRIMELILKESSQILRAKDGIIISETRHGFVCANAGIDQSNVKGDSAVLLPLDPDESAERIRRAVKKKVDKEVAVIITDTFGRTFRNGQTNVAIGIAGVNPIKSYIGTYDMYGKKLRVTEIAIADEIASASELVMGKAEGTPVAIIRGYDFEKASKASIKSLLRPKDRDLFR